MLAIYTRISGKKAEGKDTSIEIQTAEGIKVAMRLGLRYKIYTDIGISGTKDNIEDRPNLALMFMDIDKAKDKDNDKIKAVYVFDQARLERNPKIWEMFQYLVNKKDIKYYPNGVETDLSNPEIKFMVRIQSSANQLYAEQTRIKANLTFDNRASKGLTHGILPYGYEKGLDGKYKIIESEAIIVRRIFELSLTGMGTYTIANILNKEKIPTKFQTISKKETFIRKDKYTNEKTIFKKDEIGWRGNVIRDMIKNTVYKGIRVWNKKPKGKKETIEAKVDYIIEPELFDKVNRNLINNRQKSGKKSEFNYLLNGLVRCGCCGKEYRGKKRLINKDSAYKCTAIGKCPESRGISIVRFENFILNHLFINKNLKELLLNLPANVEQGAVLKNKLIKNESELETKIKVKDKFLNWLNDEDLTNDDDIKDKYKKAKRDIDILKNNIEILKIQILESDNQFAKMKVENAVNEFNLTTGFDDTKRLIHSLIEKITVTHTKIEKGGYFIVTIKYKGFEEFSTFITDWFAVKWYWTSYSRKKATNEQQLQEDVESTKAFMNYKGIPYTDEDFENFEGTESSSSMHDIIILDNNNLISFN